MIRSVLRTANGTSGFGDGAGVIAGVVPGDERPSNEDEMDVVGVGTPSCGLRA